MNPQPQLSVIVTTHKRPALLRRCLASIGSATETRTEIIVIDDSADGEGFAPSAEHGATYVRKGSALPRGPGASRNLGMRLSRGKFVTYLDDDDYFLEGGLDPLLRGVADHDFAFGNCLKLRDGEERQVDLSEVRYDDLLVLNRIPLGSGIFRRSAIEHGYDERLRSHEDWDFLLNNLAGKSMVFIDTVAVAIDKSEKKSGSHAVKGRFHFWCDFIAIYTRYPAPELAEARSKQLSQMGIELPAFALQT